jgi:tetrahydromethanopterin S-methyltransferase subunit A
VNAARTGVEALDQLRAAAEAKKCWSCGCFHGAIEAIERSIPEEARDADLRETLLAGRRRLTPVRYDCLGCEVCFPAIAMNALDVGGELCPTEPVAERGGWPPLPGDYTVLRFHGPVAVCTLTDQALAEQMAAAAHEALSIVGTLQTENLGIERLIQNVLANPRIRFLVLCGADSRGAVGHLPGQSLVALAGSGVDADMRILGAHGKRPRLRNLATRAVDHFRRTVEVIDRIGLQEVGGVLEAVEEAVARDPGPAEPFDQEAYLEPTPGHVPERMVPDPSGYFVVYPERRRRLLLLEHYRNDGILDCVIEGASPAELYTAAIDRRLVTRLDHAAYLGRELARAEHALQGAGRYVQDGAPERGEPERIQPERIEPAGNDPPRNEAAEKEPAGKETAGTQTEPDSTADPPGCGCQGTCGGGQS